MSSKNRLRLFEVNENSVNQLLFCNDSDTEDALALDDEDIGFLEDDIAQMNLNANTDDDPVEVYIEPPQGHEPEMMSIDQQLGCEELEELPLQNEPSSTSTPLSFSWKRLTDSPVNHQSRLEYESSTSFEFGKVTIDLEDKTPYEVFNKVSGFEDFIKNIVVPQTLLYCEQQAHVFTTNVDEIKAFFGMQVVMGYHQLPSLRDYWSTEPDLAVPYIANIMPRKRFEELRSYIHFNNNAMMKPREDPDHDRAFKVRLVLNHFNERFLSALTPTQHQSIDEHMVKFKGHNILRQFVKGKPIQWGFKIWCRCDSKTGYLFEGDIYCGKKKGSVEHGLGEAVVIQLTEKIKNFGCQIFIDNFFNSPSLQWTLLDNGILSAGTVRINRKHLPKTNVPSDKFMKRGDVVSFQANGITFVKWMDNKAVFLLSNFLSETPYHTVKRRKKGSKEKEAVRSPDVVKEYNSHMGGVDLMDQKKVTYQFDHRSKSKYYLRIVYDFIDIAINNAYVVYCKLGESVPSMDSKTYRRAVAQNLIGAFNSRKRLIPSSSVMTQQKRFRISQSSLEMSSHTMMKTDERKRCKLCTSKKRQNRTNNKCMQCGIHLCYVNSRNCFQLYHEGWSLV